MGLPGRFDPPSVQRGPERDGSRHRTRLCRCLSWCRSPSASCFPSRACRVRAMYRCAALPSEPCVRVIPAHGSSESLRIQRFPPFGVDLLVTVEVYEAQVPRLFRLRVSPALQVMHLQFFPVEQGCPAMAAPPLLSMGQPLLPERQSLCFTLLARCPVTPARRRVVRGSRTFYEHVPLYGHPGELQEVRSRAFVSEHPPGRALWV